MTNWMLIEMLQTFPPGIEVGVFHWEENEFETGLKCYTTTGKRAKVGGSEYVNTYQAAEAEDPHSKPLLVISF